MTARPAPIPAPVVHDLLAAVHAALNLPVGVNPDGRVALVRAVAGNLHRNGHDLDELRLAMAAAFIREQIEPAEPVAVAR